MPGTHAVFFINEENMTEQSDPAKTINVEVVINLEKLLSEAKIILDAAGGDTSDSRASWKRKALEAQRLTVELTDALDLVLSNGGHTLRCLVRANQRTDEDSCDKDSCGHSAGRELVRRARGEVKT